MYSAPFGQCLDIAMPILASILAGILQDVRFHAVVNGGIVLLLFICGLVLCLIWGTPIFYSQPIDGVTLCVYAGIMMHVYPTASLRNALLREISSPLTSLFNILGIPQVSIPAPIIAPASSSVQQFKIPKRLSDYVSEKKEGV